MISLLLFSESTPDMEESQGAYDTSSNPMLLSEHDNLQSKPIIRKQDKRVSGRYVNRALKLTEDCRNLLSHLECPLATSLMELYVTA